MERISRNGEIACSFTLLLLFPASQRLQRLPGELKDLPQFVVRRPFSVSGRRFPLLVRYSLASLSPPESRSKYTSPNSCSWSSASVAMRMSTVPLSLSLILPLALVLVYRSQTRSLNCNARCQLSHEPTLRRLIIPILSSIVATPRDRNWLVCWQSGVLVRNHITNLGLCLSSPFSFAVDVLGTEQTLYEILQIILFHIRPPSAPAFIWPFLYCSAFLVWFFPPTYVRASHTRPILRAPLLFAYSKYMWRKSARTCRYRSNYSGNLVSGRVGVDSDGNNEA